MAPKARRNDQTTAGRYGRRNLRRRANVPIYFI
jgi:hypothetical protein